MKPYFNTMCIPAIVVCCDVCDVVCITDDVDVDGVVSFSDVVDVFIGVVILISVLVGTEELDCVVLTSGFAGVVVCVIVSKKIV